MKKERKDNKNKLTDALRKCLRLRLSLSRELQSLTQTELAEKCGLLPSAISHFETGTRMPSCTNLYILAQKLQVSIDYLLGVSQYPHLKRGEFEK